MVDEKMSSPPFIRLKTPTTEPLLKLTSSSRTVSIVESISSMPIASAIGAIAITATASIIARWWQRQREAIDGVERWYQDTLGLVGRFQQVGHRSTSYGQADYPTLREKLEPLSEELMEHAASAPDGVDEEARAELVYLSAFATGLLNLSEQAEEFSGLEFFQNVQDYARESYNGDHDIEDVNKLIDSFDVDALVNEMDENVRTDENAIDDFISNFSDESLEEGQPTTIDEALQMPLDRAEDAVLEDDWLDEMMSDTLREYIRLILIDFSDEVFEAMENRKQRL